MITRADDGSLYGPFGVMGGFMQPQGHVQVAVGLLDDALAPQAALDRPRFCIEPVGAGTDSKVYLEAGLDIAPALAAMGHSTVPKLGGYARSLFGRGQIIRRDPDGTLIGGTDSRADGSVEPA